MTCTVVKKSSDLSSSQKKNIKRWKEKQEKRSKQKAATRKDLGENAFAKALK